MRAWKKSLLIAREERLGKNLARPSGEERKTFKFRRFSQGRHWEPVQITRESLIARRKCYGKVSPMSVEPWTWIRLRACISSVRSDRREQGFFLTSLSGDFFQALITDFSKKLWNFEIFGGVSNLVFIVLWCKLIDCCITCMIDCCVLHWFDR
jgi:hypothetical protein